MTKQEIVTLLNELELTTRAGRMWNIPLLYSELKRQKK